MNEHFMNVAIKLSGDKLEEGRGGPFGAIVVRTSDNKMTTEKVGWQPKYSLKEGLEKTYNWIYKQMTSEKSNAQKFTRF